ncbi:MAG: hypothetical protein QM784_16450 [Polyangiaceae bacterium]
MMTSLVHDHQQSQSENPNQYDLEIHLVRRLIVCPFPACHWAPGIRRGSEDSATEYVGHGADKGSTVLVLGGSLQFR